jgi:hypothetical protein
MNQLAIVLKPGIPSLLDVRIAGRDGDQCACYGGEGVTELVRHRGDRGLEAAVEELRPSCDLARGQET